MQVKLYKNLCYCCTKQRQDSQDGQHLDFRFMSPAKVFKTTLRLCQLKKEDRENLV